MPESPAPSQEAGPLFCPPQKPVLLLLNAAPRWFIIAQRLHRDKGNATVNDEKLDGAEALWTAEEENFLMLARELEWAEAYAADHPACPMGHVYLNFLQWEMITAQAKW